MSRVRACRLVGLNRSSLNYRSKRPDDSTVRQRLRELAAERRRFGYRRLGWLLAREGHVMNRKKLYRIYREEKLMVRRRGRRKRAIGTRAPLALPDTINRRWSLDFVSDALSDGRRFRIFCVVDDFSRECLATIVDISIGGVRVVRELERLVTERGGPTVIVSDNGCEPVSLGWSGSSTTIVKKHLACVLDLDEVCRKRRGILTRQVRAFSRYKFASPRVFSCPFLRENFQHAGSPAASTPAVN
jgi:transposase InsO family protein